MNNQRPNSPVQVPEEAAIGLAEVLAEDITEQPLVPTIRQQKPEKPENFFLWHATVTSRLHVTICRQEDFWQYR